MMRMKIWCRPLDHRRGSPPTLPIKTPAPTKDRASANGRLRRSEFHDDADRAARVVAIHVGLALAGEQVFLRPAAVVGVVAGGGWLATRRGGLLISWPKW